jgi:hypothetical protein
VETSVPVEGGDVVVLSTVQGLVSEAARVEAAFREVEPSVVALGISPESAGALLRYQPRPDEDPFEDLPDAEVAYSVALAKFGPVDLPPPDLVAAARLARERGIPVYGVDLTEEAYVTAFSKEVSGWSLLRWGRRQRRLARRPPAASDARAFSLAWDAQVRRVAGIARVEEQREAAIAAGARALAKQAGGRVLLVVDAPREAGVLRGLTTRQGEA